MADVHHGGGSGSWAGLQCWMLRCAHSPSDGLKDVMLNGNVRKSCVGCNTMVTMLIISILKNHILTERYSLHNIRMVVLGVGMCYEDKR